MSHNTQDGLTVQQQLVGYALELLGEENPATAAKQEPAALRQQLVELVNTAMARLNATVPLLIQCDTNEPCAFEFVGGIWPTFSGECHDPSVEANAVYNSQDKAEPYAFTEQDAQSIDEFIESKAAVIAWGAWTYATVFAPTVKSAISHTGEGIRVNLSVRPSDNVSTLRQYELSVFWWGMEATPQGGCIRSLNGEVSSSTFRPGDNWLKFYKNTVSVLDGLTGARERLTKKAS